MNILDISKLEMIFIKKCLYLMKIIITESQLKKIISNTLIENITEWNDVIRFPQGFVDKKGPEWKRARISSESEKHPNLDPSGFQWFGDTLRHNGKSSPKSAPKQKISKPEGMSPKQYEDSIVKKYNEKYAKESQSLFPEEEFRPIRNSGRYFRGEADYSNYYEISNYGRLKVINFEDASKCRIVNGYDAPSSKAMQFNLNGDQHTCPPVHNMVADAFLEPKDPHDFMVKHKNGDYHDNRAENLEWVPRKNRRNNLSVKLKG